MKLNIPKNIFDTYDDEQKAFLRENFTCHSSGDRCWHSKDGVEENVPLNAITEHFGHFKKKPSSIKAISLFASYVQQISKA